MVPQTLDSSVICTATCIQGKFVTNAPAYLTDIIGAKGLGVAAEALAQAQTTTMASSNGTTSSITGNAGSFALGRMGSGATDEPGALAD